MKLKKTGTGLVVTLLLLSVFSVASFAYSFEYTSLPSDYQEQIAEMYDEYHSFDPACYSFETFKDMSTVFPDTSSPSWRSLSSFNSGGLSSQSDFKAFADSNPDAPVIRCIYAENTDSSDRYTTMYATADIISNRSTTSGYSDGTYTLKGVVMKKGQFDCMSKGYAVRNPFLYDNTTERGAYEFATYLAYIMNDNQEAAFILPSTYYNFHDTINDSSIDVPFFIKNSDGTYTRCSLTESSLESATHYYSGGVYNPIRSNAPPVLYGTTVFYSY